MHARIFRREPDVRVVRLSNEAFVWVLAFCGYVATLSSFTTGPAWWVYVAPVLLLGWGWSIPRRDAAVARILIENDRPQRGR